MAAVCYDTDILTRLAGNVRHMGIVDQANKIIDEHVTQGFDLTLRQLYYQFVARRLA